MVIGVGAAIKSHLRYLSYVVRHKWFVFVAGLKTGAPLGRLLIHDWSKFTPTEWRPYVLSFYGPWKYQDRPEYVVAAFDRAWLHHQKANRHHWQYWVLMEDSPDGMKYRIVSYDGGMLHHALTTDDRVFLDLPQLAINGGPDGDARYRLLSGCVRDANRYRALPMPESYIREMVADWMGAGRAITGKWETADWYAKNRDKIVLHPNTRVRVEEILAS